MRRVLAISIIVALFLSVMPAAAAGSCCDPCKSPLTQGYWKNHPEAWLPSTYFDYNDFLGSGVTWMDVLQTEPKGGNAYYILAHQWIAVKLNDRAGAYPPGEVADAWYEARSILEKYAGSMSIPKTSADRDRAIYLADILDRFNNGYYSP
jgi:hypothetical protein